MAEKHALLVFAIALVGFGVAGALAQPSAMGSSEMAAQAAAGEAPAEAEADAEADAQLSPQERARRARVYAEVGDVAITVGDIEDAIAEQSPFLRARYRDPAKLRELADGLVRFELLAREADRRGYGENAAVEQQVEQAMVQRLIEREFDQRITRESIPQEDVQAYYDEHESEFSRPAMVRASHILLPSREAADALLPEVRDADARQFRALARQHSIDTETKLRGGDLRYFTQTGRPPNANEEDPPVDETLVAAAFEIDELGAVAGPVQVGESWSLVKLTGRREPETRSLEQAQEGIRLRLWRERRQQAIDDFVSNLRQEANVERHVERMRPIRLEPIEPAKGLPGGHERQEGRAPGSSMSAMGGMEAATMEAGE
jgi:peptidyl-prolyl cis-trans isomerase C